nr:immunoglobulin heavy chain junction region [Mus musculus]
CARSPLGNW